MSNELTNYDQIRHGIHQMRQRLASSLPDGDAVRFQGIIMNAIDANPKLAECTPESIFGVAMLMAQLGLEPGPLGLAYMIPRKMKGRMVATFQAGYRGLVQLALRSGDIETIYAHYVCENDDFKLKFGTNEVLDHIPAFKNRGNVIGYYSVAKMVNGGTAFDFMNVQEVHQIRDKFAYGGKSGPWKDSPTEMGKKTVVKRLTKYLPVRTDYARGLSFEGHTIEVTANNSIQSADGLEFFDVTDAIPEIAVEHIPKIEAPKPKPTPPEPVKTFTLTHERKFLRGLVGVFDKARQADIMAAVKWKCGIESLKDANEVNISQEQLEKVNSLTVWMNKGDEGVLDTKTKKLVAEWSAATAEDDAAGEIEARFVAIKELHEAAKKHLENDQQVDAFLEAVHAGRDISDVPTQEMVDVSVAIWAAEDPKKHCINIMNKWEASQVAA